MGLIQRGGVHMRVGVTHVIKHLGHGLASDIGGVGGTLRSAAVSQAA